MVGQRAKLAQLERLARLKAERELKKFAAFSEHMTVAQRHVDSLQTALRQCYENSAPLSVPEARMANAQSARSARELSRAKAELVRIKPRFEKMRDQAAREFGRAEVLLQLAETARKTLHRF